MPHDNNGNGVNPAGPPAHRRRLEQMLDYHQTRADAIRITLELLDETITEVKQRTLSSVMDKAVALDQERRSKRVRQTHTVITERRQKTAAILDSLDRTEPRPITERKHIATLLKNGYIKQKGDGFVRTAKKFNVTKTDYHNGGQPRDRASMRATRQETVHRLAGMSRTEPRPITSNMGILVAHGYLVRKGDGFVLTGKEYKA